MLNKVFRAPDLVRHCALLASAMLASAAILDLSGWITGKSWLWVAGGRFLPVAVVAAAVGGVVVWFRRGRGGAFVLMAALLAGLARWLRGSAGVPPDPPLVATELLSVGLALIGYWRARRHSLAISRSRVAA